MKPILDSVDDTVLFIFTFESMYCMIKQFAKINETLSGISNIDK